MKILVTGHSCYIGTILTQMLLKSGHQVVGIDIDLYAKCTFGLDDAAPIPSIDCDIRELPVAQLKRFDAIAHLAGVCNDPRRSVSGNDLRGQRKGHDPAGRAGCRGGIDVSCSRRAAAFTARHPRIGSMKPRRQILSRLTAHRNIKPRADFGWQATSFLPSSARSATAYGFAAHPLRPGVEQPYGLRLHQQARLPQERWPAWRPIVHIADISRAFLAQLRRQGRPCTARSSMSESPPKTTAYARSRKSLRTVPGSSITAAHGAGPDKRSYRVDCSKIAMQLPKFRPQWTADTARSSTNATRIRSRRRRT